MNQEELEPSFYAIIPVQILEDRKLPANAKLLYAEIISLSRKSGDCYATNKYLALRIGLSEESITGLVKILKERKLIDVSIKKDKEGTRRLIRGRLFNLTGEVQQHTPGRLFHGHIIDNNKETITKDTQKVQSDFLEINELIYFFKAVNPMIGKYYERSSERDAVRRLLKVYGREKLEQMIKALPAVNAQKYWPKSTTPIQLENNVGIYEQKKAELNSPQISNIHKTARIT